MIRRMAVGLVLLVTGGSLAACAGSNHSSATTATRPPTTTGTGAAASRPLTKRQAIALARAVNLRATDVPGFTASSGHAREHETAAEKRLQREALRCVGALDSPSVIAEVGSKDFKLEHNILNFSVHSEVSVAKTAALAAKQLALFRSARVRTCLSHYLDLLFKGKAYRGATVSPVSILSGTPPAHGTTGSFGWRITATFTVRRIAIPFYFDILGFTYGPADVTLFSSGLPEPFPATAQERLFLLLLARSKKHST